MGDKVSFAGIGLAAAERRAAAVHQGIDNIRATGEQMVSSLEARVDQLEIIVGNIIGLEFPAQVAKQVKAARAAEREGT